MDQYVLSSIEVRRKSIFDTYIIDDPDFVEKANNVFKQMEAFGESCANVMDFESKFAASPLYTEYYNLCLEAGQKFKVNPKATQVEMPDSSYTSADVVKEAEEWTEYAIDSATQPIRNEIYEETRKAVESIPGVGEVAQAARTVGVFKKFFGK